MMMMKMETQTFVKIEKVGGESLSEGAATKKQLYPWSTLWLRRSGGPEATCTPT
jgi:hypothetical protein